jgi:uncharacterized protein YbjT (DUF2867 family)
VSDDRPIELVTGASGYVGARLLARLREEGRRARALARRPEAVDAREGVEVVRGDLLTGEGLEAALDGCATAYYLIHSMEAGTEDFRSRDRRAAGLFGDAARRAGVERIVYLGGLAPAGGRPSPHLASRLEVEELLLEAVPASTALRASIVVGARSSSFRILVRLVERLRLLPLSPWADNRTRPVDERDAVEYLARTPSVPAAAGRSLDIAGPDEVSYGELLERVAEGMGVGRAGVEVIGAGPALTSVVVSVLADQPLELVRPLMESLEHDLLPRSDEARVLYGLTPRRLARAIDHALAEWERTEPLAAR